MTEEEMKTKWCPKAKADAVPRERLPPGSTNIHEAHARCIGSACAWWRWVDLTPLCVIDGGDGREIINTVENAKKHDFKIIRELMPQGYCGAAGEP